MQKAAQMTAEEKEVRDVLLSIVDAYKRRDVEEAVSVYHPQVVQLDVPLPIYSRGKERNRKATADFFVAIDGDIYMEYTDVHVKVYPGANVATAWGVVKFDVALKAGVKLANRDRFKVNIRIVDVLEK